MLQRNTRQPGPAYATEQTPQWHNLTVENALAALGSDASRGLEGSEASARLTQFGHNTLPEAKRLSLVRIFLHQFNSPLIYILFVAALFALLVGERSDAAVILAVVVINAMIGAFQEGRAERSMASLRQIYRLEVRVLRSGGEALVSADRLVPGDVILLEAGDAVAADARLIEVSLMATSEAAVTGESLPVPKEVAALPPETLLAERNNMVYAGTHIAAGRGKGVVVATGESTEVGQIARLTETAEVPPTPLEVRVRQFGHYLAAAALGLFTLVMGIGTLRGIPLKDIFMVAISQMVSMVPEGLPVAVTVALAVGMQRMARRGAIVRRLAAVETLGCTSVICSDKTGTLTMNAMSVTAIWLPDGRELEVSGAGYSPEGEILDGGDPVQAADDPQLNSLLEVATLCNNAALLPPDDTSSQWRIIGDPTEGALLTMAAKGNVTVESLAQRYRRTGEIPFETSAKMMATEYADLDGRHHIFLKGAPEIILSLCFDAGDEKTAKPLGQEEQERIAAAVGAFAERALRVLALGVLENGRIDGKGDFQGLRGRVRLAGLVGQEDPARKGVADSITKCQSAGIGVVMITGDHRSTALAVAKSLGIADQQSRVVDGQELEATTAPGIAAIPENIAVYARVLPEQKLHIIEALQGRGHVVAMTGDGVNDGPALARADVGVAMGLSGTEVARNAADIVITDDNFATIVDAVEEGRLVYRNLKKVILYLVATSLAEIAVLLAALVGGFPLPLAAVQILWINIVTEGTVTINLIMDPPEGDEMRRQPVPLSEPILNPALLRRVALMTPMMALSTLSYFIWHHLQGVPYAQLQTETFTVLAACQWFNVLNCQSELRSAFRLSILGNRWLLGGLVVGVSLQLMVIYWQPMNTAFHTAPIPPADLLLILCVSSLVLWAEELRKYFARRRLAAHDPAVQGLI